MPFAVFYLSIIDGAIIIYAENRNDDDDEEHGIE